MHAYSTRTRAVDASKNNKDRETRSRDIEVLLCSYKGQTITGIAAKCISISIERTVKEKRYCRLDRPSKGPFRGLFFSHRFLLSVVRIGENCGILCLSLFHLMAERSPGKQARDRYRDSSAYEKIFLNHEKLMLYCVSKAFKTTVRGCFSF